MLSIILGPCRTELVSAFGSKADIAFCDANVCF